MGRVAAIGQCSSWSSRGHITGAQIPLNTMQPYCRHECALQAFLSPFPPGPALRQRVWGVGATYHRLVVGRNLEEDPRGAKGPTIEKAAVRVCLKLQRWIRANEDGGWVPSSAQDIYVLAFQVALTSGGCAGGLGRSFGVQTAQAIVARGVRWYGMFCLVSV